MAAMQPQSQSEYVQLSDHELSSQSAFEHALFHADSGNADAMYALGVIYLNVKKDVNAAIMWFRRAADKNHNDATFNLGILLRGKEKPDEAITLFKLIIERGDIKTENRKPFWKIGVFEVEYQIAACLKELNQHTEAIKMLDKLDKEGNSSATYQLGLYQLLEENYQMAAKFFEKAKESGHLTSQYELACMHRDGNHPNADSNEAKTLFLDAAQKGHNKSLFSLNEPDDIRLIFKLACLHFNGKHPQSDKSKAVSLWKLAASKGHVESKHKLKFCEANHKDLFV